MQVPRQRFSSISRSRARKFCVASETFAEPASFSLCSRREKPCLSSGTKLDSEGCNHGPATDHSRRYRLLRHLGRGASGRSALRQDVQLAACWSPMCSTRRPTCLPSSGRVRTSSSEAFERRSRKRFATLSTGKTAELLKGVPEVELSVIQHPSPGRALVEMAEDEGADLVILGSHGRSGLSRAFLGSVAERVVRHAPCPVLVVRGRCDNKPKDGE